jgi:hypothetical protein
LTLRAKLDRFPDGIALILPYGSKGQPVAGSVLNRYMKGWEKRTLEETRTRDYLADLYNLPCNVAIRQGGGVTPFVSFDFDTDQPWVSEAFFKANPKLAKSFMTKGARGFNVWFLIKGAYPASKKEIDVNGEKVEWRGNGYVLIHGRHPSGVDYTILQDAPIVEVEWAELVCPGPEWKNWPRAYEKKEGEKEHQKGSLAKASPWQIKRRREYVEREYEVLSWNEDYSKAQVECKNKDRHSTDTGDGQTIIFTGADSKGLVSYYCSHSHCREEVDGVSFNKEESSALYEGILGAETFILHQQNELLDETLRDLFGHMASLDCYYRRSEKPPYGIIFWRSGLEYPVELSYGTMASSLGREKILFSKRTKKGLSHCLAPEAIVKAILESPYASLLPIARAIIERPLLVKTPEGALLRGNCYVPELETIILDSTDTFPEMEFKEGVELLNLILDFWIWKEPEDRSRGLAELLTPALLQGGFLRRPIPGMLLMADESRAGKTFWHSIVSWSYGVEPDPHVMLQMGSGNINEQLQYSLIQGKSFFFIDELVGNIQSNYVNAIITGGDETTARTLFGKFSVVPTDKTMIQLAGVKGFVVDPQLASRVIPIRIIKPADDGEYHWAWPDGTLLRDWFRTDSNKVLAAMYAVIKKWAADGYPIDPAESRFPSWAMPVNGLLTKTLNLPAATQGLEEAQAEISGIAGNWLPELFAVLVDLDLVWNGQGAAKMLSAASIAYLSTDHGLTVPERNPSKVISRSPRAQQGIERKAIKDIFGLLAKTGVTVEGRPIVKSGDFYILPFMRRSPSGSGNKYEHFVIGRNTSIPRTLEHYIPEKPIDTEP